MFIEVTAPIPEAYLRMAHAMDEVKKFLIPVWLSSTLCSLVASSTVFACVAEVFMPYLQEPCEADPYMDPHFLNGSQDGSVRGRGGLMGRGRGGPPGPR